MMLHVTPNDGSDRTEKRAIREAIRARLKDPSPPPATQTDTWSAKYNSTYVFRIPYEVAERLVPPPLVAFEEEGFGLVEFGFVHFDGTCMPDTDPDGFHEISFAVGVVPRDGDHKKWMAFHTLTLTSESKAFLDDCEQQVHLPVYRWQTSVQFQRNGDENDVSLLADGQHVLTLQTKADPWIYWPCQMAFAEVTGAVPSGEVWACLFGARGALTIVKPHHDDHRCEFHPHPFFSQIPTNDGSTFDPGCIVPLAKTIYLAKPGTTVVQHFTPMAKISP